MRPLANLPQFLQGFSPIRRLREFFIFSIDLITTSIAQDILQRSANPDSPNQSNISPGLSHQESTVTSGIKMPEPVIYTPGPSNPSSRQSSVFVPASGRDGTKLPVVELDGYESPPPSDERAALVKSPAFRLPRWNAPGTTRSLCILYLEILRT